MDGLKSLEEGLRDWQRVALEEWRKYDFRGIIEVVTGGGKTRFALAAASAWLAGQGSDAAVLIIVPTTALQDQWYVNLTSDLGIEPEKISLWPEKRDVTAKFHVMVVNTARNRAQELARVRPNLLLIADECHRYASLENARSLEVRSSASLGLTATAEREYDDGLERVLVPNLGPIIFRYSLAEARKDGVISNFDLFNVRVPFDSDEKMQYDKATRALGAAIASGDEERAKRIAMRRSSIVKNAISRVTSVVVIAEKLRGKRMIVFHEDIAMANLITELLRDRGHRVVAFHTRISKDLRRDNLRMFKAGLADVLVCCRALDEGLDVPEAECAILAASTASHRQRVQRLGRVLRTHDSKERAIVYTLYVSDQEEERLSREIELLAGISEIRWQELSH